MSTVIFKWNPNFSSYNMFGYLYNIVEANYGEGLDDFNWSVWDYDKIHEGDRFYWMKLGYGTVGIVGAGTITSEPYQGEDWSGKGRPTYYVNFRPEILLNPDALPILDVQTLTSRIPEFEWEHGHSGLVLEEDVAARMNKLWDAFVEEHKEEFERKARNQRRHNDYIYWDAVL